MLVSSSAVSPDEKISMRTATVLQSRHPCIRKHRGWRNKLNDITSKLPGSHQNVGHSLGHLDWFLQYLSDKRECIALD